MLEVVKKGIIRRKLVIDFVSATMTINNKDERQYIKSRLASMQKWDGVFAGFVARRQYRTGMRLHVGSATPSTALFQVDPFRPLSPYFRVEYNPANADPERLQKVFGYILPGSWARFVEEGYCTRLDLAVDVEGVRLGEFLVHWPGMRRSRQFFGSGKVLEDTMLRTYEIGKYGGDRYLVVYDKKRQQMKKLGVLVEQEGSENELTRFEVRVKPRTKWTDVAVMDNVFNEIKVSSLAAFTSNNDRRFARFLRICQIDGAQNALLMYEDKDRELFRSRLALAKTPWWSPEAIWTEFNPSLLEHLKS